VEWVVSQETTASDKLIIRTFTPEDQRASRTLVLNGMGEHFGIIDESLNPDLDDIMSHYLSAGHEFVVAELNGELIGTGALVRESTGVGRLVRMSVKRGYRRQGIGRALVAHLLQLARQRGDKQVLVETNHDWVAALGLYQRYGFRQYHQDEESIHLRFDIG
jgi:ribosomal protein S18 acetylase RimI-like enzyme